MPRFLADIGLAVLGTGCGGGSLSTPPSPLIGRWGAIDTDAELQLSSLGGSLRVLSACDWGGPLDSPVIPDVSGHFDVTGTYTSNLPPESVHYVGSGDTITLTVVKRTNQTRAVYTLVKNQQPPPFTGVCPG